jgi:hypothetical protein
MNEPVDEIVITYGFYNQLLNSCLQYGDYTKA